MKNPIIVVLFALFASTSGFGAKAPLSDDQLNEQAAHVIRGTVLEIASKVQKSEIEVDFGSHTDRIFTITIKVESVLKGAGLKEGEEVIIEAWTPKRRLPPRAGLQGHQPIPEKGDEVTAYLVDSGGKLEPILPNGIEIHE